MEDNFNDYKVQVDSDCITSDFDDYDLYGELLEEPNDDFGNEIEFN